MNNPRLAGRYAKSLMDLAIEQNELEAVYADMKFIRFICKSNPDFVTVLKSPIINSDKKGKIIESVTRESICPLTSQFIHLLVRKTREKVLFDISESFLEQYNQLKGIHKLKLTTASAISSELQQAIVEKVKSTTSMKNIELEVVVNEKLIGGFKLEVGDTLVDASVLRDLNDIKKQFLSNDYIHRIK